MRLVAALALVSAACATRPAPLPSSAPDRLRADVSWLADDARAGRATGTREAREVTAWLAARLAAARLDPLPGGSFEQPFDVALGSGSGEETLLALGDRRFVPGVDFEPYAYTDAGQVTAPLAFAGYGISAPELGWDDYAGLDVTGRLVVVLAHEPREHVPGSAFRSPAAVHHRDLREKARVARAHGAVGLLVAPDRHHHAVLSEAVAVLRGPPSPSAGLPVASVATATAEALVDGLDALARQLDESGKPASRLLDRTLAFTTDPIRTRARATNVCGVVPGREPALEGEVVVLAAHADHLGRGGPTSLAPDRAGEIHNGADDDASGTAAVLAIAAALRADPPRRTVVACLFDAEELGLLGSVNYLENQPFPIDRTVAMVNLDMVGRLRANRLQILGTAPRTDLARLATDLTLVLDAPDPGPGDHTTFAAAGVPSLLLFTGLHDDYHRPDDDTDRLDFQGLQRITTFAATLVRALADTDTPPPRHAPIPSRRPPTPAAIGVELSATTSSGVNVLAVHEGSPAALAGLRAGDLLERFAGFAISHPDDLAFALAHTPAGTVNLRWRRGPVVHTGRTTLPP